MSNTTKGPFMQAMEKYTKSIKTFISAQGFGHYSKPSGGIPKSDLSSTVQTSLGKADSALQSEDVSALNSGLVDTINNGAKNLFNPTSVDNSIATINIDKSITVNYTTTTSDTYIHIAFDNRDYSWCIMPDEWKGIIFSNLPNNLTGGIFLLIEYSNNGIGWSSEQDLKVGTSSVTLSSSYTYCRVAIKIPANTANATFTVYPMICTKSQFDLSPDYEPYALGNQILTPAMIQKIDEGVKNIAIGKNNSGSGGTATLQSDGFTVKLTGSATEDTSLAFASAEVPVTGTYKFVINSYGTMDCVYIWDNTSSAPIDSPSLYGTGELDVELIAGHSYAIAHYAGSAMTLNATVSFMICSVADYDVSHKIVPYRPNWDLISSVTPFLTVPINHNMIYRGQNLGEALTDAQHTALSSGNFTDLYLGDYWTKSVTIPDFYKLTTAQPSDWTTNYTSYYTKSGNTYTAVTGSSAPAWAADTYYQKSVSSQTVTLKAVIADFDTFYAGYASSYAAINTHHAAVIVTGFNNVVWNKTNTTAGGYVNSLIHKWLVGSVLPEMETWFGSAKVLSHQKLLTNAITGDAASGWAWSSQKIALLSENQMYGSKVWGNSKAANGGYEPGEAHKHLNIFNHIDANLLFGNKNIWLRDIASAVWAADLSYDGGANDNDASNAWIAPAALILLS